MRFTFKVWDDFCKKLSASGVKSITAKDVFSEKLNGQYFVLKHDVETDVKRALAIAKIENKYEHRGSYYVQAYLLENEKNSRMLKEIQAFGHEVSYHHDVMDSNKGGIAAAIAEFDKNTELFNRQGFEVVTVCQHGNPIVERIGYSSNRDFFRNADVKERYPNCSDIMVNFKEKADTEYLYFSDAGRKFNLIYDPINNDITNSDDKNQVCDNLDKVIEMIGQNNAIISIHPHRWTASEIGYVVKTVLFKTIKGIARICVKIPVLNKIMSKYYYLAKKI